MEIMCVFRLIVHPQDKRSCRFLSLHRPMVAFSLLHGIHLMPSVRTDPSGLSTLKRYGILTTLSTGTAARIISERDRTSLTWARSVWSSNISIPVDLCFVPLVEQETSHPSATSTPKSCESLQRPSQWWSCVGPKYVYSVGKFGLAIMTKPFAKAERGSEDNSKR